MNKDIRISVSFYNHIKRRKLEKKLGAKGVLCLIDLWLYAGMNRPDGVLEGMAEEDIALAAQWDGQAEEFVKTLVELKLLDIRNDTYVLHDWEEHNTYASHAKERSELAKRNQLIRWMKEYGCWTGDFDESYKRYLQFKQKRIHCVDTTIRTVDTQNTARIQTVYDSIQDINTPSPICSNTCDMQAGMLVACMQYACIVLAVCFPLLLLLILLLLPLLILILIILILK